ncbi:MAG TPA: FAD-dependent monooxygenase [Bryobacteraceae bacterium]|jgi:2-polyprenyl-6-methoxyphenol hydroxylase-like FAD-dependent oxidoreductase|nr:FAD-dependent monooxygenase [Bryobacteraceae bacterium]
MNAIDHSVVIVGAGPTGLSLGAELYRLGESPLILDRLAAGENTSRACVVHARTLEVLEPMGATSELRRHGLEVQIFRIRERSRILATVNFKDLRTKYPFTLMCPQNRVEDILLQRLQGFGGAVERPTEVIAIRPGENDVELQVKCGEDTRTIHANWVIGCDGAHSVVREQAAIPFEGGAYEESFILADVEMHWPISRDEVTLFYSEKGLVVVAPLPDDHFRIVATEQQAAAEPSIADFESILDERGPMNGALTIRRMLWSSRFHIQHRVASALRQGRILLAGDAAHVHSPAGGQGMNTGIQDAVSLANALRQTLQSGQQATLNTWQTERLKVAHSVVDLTDRLTKVATISSPVLKVLRNTAVELVGNVPFATRAAAERLAELTYK